MPIRSLRQMAVRACLRRLPDLSSVGALDFAVIKDILERITCPQQLREIESNSPQIKKDSGVLWIKLIESDFPLESRAKRYVAENPRNWSKVYFRYLREREESLKRATSQLKSSLGIIHAAALERTVKKMTSDTIISLNGGGRPHRFGGNRTGFGTAGSSRTKTTAQNIILKARREASEIVHMRNLASAAITRRSNNNNNNNNSGAASHIRTGIATVRATPPVPNPKQQAAFLSVSALESFDSCGPQTRECLVGQRRPPNGGFKPASLTTPKQCAFSPASDATGVRTETSGLSTSPQPQPCVTVMPRRKRKAEDLCMRMPKRRVI